MLVFKQIVPEIASLRFISHRIPVFTILANKKISGIHFKIFLQDSRQPQKHKTKI